MYPKHLSITMIILVGGRTPMIPTNNTNTIPNKNGARKLKPTNKQGALRMMNHRRMLGIP